MSKTTINQEEKQKLQKNVKNNATLIWNIADILRGTYKPHEYGNVIIPFTVLRRFDCVLEKTKQAVLDVDEKCKASPLIKEELLKEASGYPFYNTSNYTFKKLASDSNNIVSNFRDYINGFSENIREILDYFELENHIGRLEGKNQKKKKKVKKLLYPVIKEFEKKDLHIESISNIEMGYIFEEIIRRFSESHNADAGQFYTPREVIELMTSILFLKDEDILSKDDVTASIYDPACGTGGMLSASEEYIKALNKDAGILLYGQELNEMTWAICQSDLMIKNNDTQSEQVIQGDTLTEDGFANKTFNYILSNPPFGGKWSESKDEIEEEAKKGFKGRFGAGLPATSDSQMLFLQHAISKMNPNGARVAIIHNGSPLFNGDAGSGESKIRQYILEKDLLEAIIALPNEIFYNTGITSYIWVLSNKKEQKRKGKVQLINANGLYERRRKSLGKKRNDISQSAIETITKIYGDFVENEISQIYENSEFRYTQITVERPKRDENGEIIYKKGKPEPDSELRTTENVPFKEDIKEYFAREVLPYASDAWIDEKKNKIGYEIPFTRYFYKYTPPTPSDEILQEIQELGEQITHLSKKVFE